MDPSRDQIHRPFPGSTGPTSGAAQRPTVTMAWTVPLLLATVVALAACGGNRGILDGPIARNAPAPRLDAEQLDALTNAYADRFMTLVVGATDAIKEGNPSPEQRRMAHLFKTAAVASIYDIASNPDPFTQLIDMLLVVSLLAEVWIGEMRADEVFGPLAERLVQPLGRAHDDIWNIAARTMRPEQIEALRMLIWEWHRANPDIQFVSFVRFDDFADARSRAIVSDVRRGGGLLAPIDDARLEVERTRRLAERAFFYAKRAGFLAAWEAEALVLELLAEPSVRQALDNSTGLTEAIDRASTTFAELPDRLTEERIALLDHLTAERVATLDRVTQERMALIEAFDARHGALDETLRELRATAEEGERLAHSVTGTVESSERMLVQMARTSGALTDTIGAVERLAARFDPADRPPPTADAATFDLETYATAFAQLADAARELNALVAASLTLMESEAWTMRLQEAGAKGDSFADGLRWRAISVIAAFFALLLAYRVIVLLVTRRLSPPPNAT